MMTDEAMAQYGSLRLVETLEGAAAAESYRCTGYRGTMPIRAASVTSRSPARDATSRCRICRPRRAGRSPTARAARRLLAPEFRFDKTSVRLHAETGIVQALLVVTEKTDGGPRPTVFALLDVWIRVDGAWRLLTRYVEKSPGR